MPVTSSLGLPQSQLGQLALGLTGARGPFFGFKVHVLSSRTVRVVFDVPVGDEALDPGAYSLLPVSAVWSLVTPPAERVDLYDADRTSVAVTFSQPLTLAATYSMQVRGVPSADGTAVSSTSTYNFSATVPDPPRATGAYMSERGCVDLVFDRPVRDQSALTASAQIVCADPFHSSALVPLPPKPGIPETSVRFSVTPDFPTGAGFTVNYQGVTDWSFNVGSGSVPLDARLRAPQPVDFNKFLRAQLTDAWVDWVDQAMFRSYISVFFSCPVHAADVLDLSNWELDMDGVHLLGGTPPVTAADPVDTSTLLAFLGDFVPKYNSHLSIPGVHRTDADFPASIYGAVGLINDLRAKFNDHARKHPLHAVSDVNDQILLRPAVTEAQAVALATALKAKFNSHLTGSSGAVPYHLVDDTVNTAVTANPTTLQEAAVLADELRTRLYYHLLDSPGYHAGRDSANLPSAPYCLSRIVLTSPATAHDAWSTLIEAQYKYQAHVVNRAAHVYSDDLHNLPSAQYIQDPTVADYVASVLKTLFNGHILERFDAGLDRVDLLACDETTAPPVSDAFTYRVRLRVKARALEPSYRVRASVRSSDLQSRTVPADFSGDVVARPYVSQPELLAASVRPEGASFLFDRGVSLPLVDDVRLASAGGPALVTGVSLFASVRAVRDLVADSMVAFKTHLSEYGVGAGPVHKSTDTLDSFPDSALPGMSEASIVAAVNLLKQLFNAHAAGDPSQQPYHFFSALSDQVRDADATDMASAAALSHRLADAVRDHRANRSTHASSGRQLQFAQRYDGLTVSYGGLRDGAPYELGASLKRAPSGDHSFPPYELRFPLRGVASPPFLASAVPELATAVPGRLARDTLSVFFSKPMQRAPVGPPNLVFTGPSGLLAGPSYWRDDRVLSVQVRGMAYSAQYGMDVEGLSDPFGNEIQSFSPPPPPPQIPYIPNSCVVPVSVDADFANAGPPNPPFVVPGQVGPDCASVTFNDGRYAAFFQFEVPDVHTVVVDVTGPWNGFSYDPMPFDSVINVLRLDRTVAATVSGMLNDSSEQLSVVLQPGTYFLEVTTGSVGETGGVTVDVGTMCHIAAYPGFTTFGVVGVGCGSTSSPGDFAVFLAFVADAPHTTVTLNSAPWTTLAVHDGSDSGPVLGSGPTGAPVGFVTAPGSLYVIEVYTPDPGPTDFSVDVQDV